MNPCCTNIESVKKDFTDELKSSDSDEKFVNFSAKIVLLAIDWTASTSTSFPIESFFLPSNIISTPIALGLHSSI